MSPPGERRQFRILYRDFLFRLVDLEVLSPDGDIQKLVGQLVALLAAFGFVLGNLVLRYVRINVPHARVLTLALADQEFLFATAMAVTGLFAVIAWNVVLPDRRDGLVLGPLPLRTRTIFAAKVAALATALCITVIAVNWIVGLTLPFVLAVHEDAFLSQMRALAAYWITAAAAGAFTFCGLLALQGIAAQLLPYRVFLRASSFLQLAALFAILGIYFLIPPLAKIELLSAPQNRLALDWLPSYWFLGLFQELNGPLDPVFGFLAKRALAALALVIAASAAAYTLAYFGHARKLIEQPDIAPEDRTRPFARALAWIASATLHRPLDRAIVQFASRTIARSRQHRFLLAAYAGAALAIGLAYAKNLIYSRSLAAWTQPAQPLLAATFVLLVFAILGMRAVFAFPTSLRANWIFRITSTAPPKACFAATRSAVYTLAAAPVWLSCAFAFLLLWPAQAALEHLAVLAVAGIVAVERSLYQFPKIPFTCSYLPGGANLKVKFGIYAIVLLTVAELGTTLEFWAMHKPSRMAVLLAILLAVAISSRIRTTLAAQSPAYRIQFEESPPVDLLALDLHPGALQTRI